MGSLKNMTSGGVALAGALVLAVGLCSPVIAKPCSKTDEPDTGKRVKCKMENLNEAFDGVVTTVLGDDTGAFSDQQKQQLSHLRDRAESETERTTPEDFKHLGKKRKVECVIQEILGDVMDADDADGDGLCDPDEGENCIGNEDGICDEDEQVLPVPYIGGCAEALNDGKGNDDGICEFKGASGKPKEACLETCDADVLLKEEDCAQIGDKKSCNSETGCKWDNQAMVCEERGVDRGRADDLEQALDDATAVIGEANAGLARFIEARRLAAKVGLSCSGTSPCERLQCLIQEERRYTANEIEGVVGGAAAAKLIADGCRDVGNADFFVNCSACCVAPGLIASGLSIAAITLEVIDDGETGERLDATAACLQQTGGEIQEVKALVQQLIDLLLLPPGRRPGFNEINR